MKKITILALDGTAAMFISAYGGCGGSSSALNYFILN